MKEHHVVSVILRITPVSNPSRFCDSWCAALPLGTGVVLDPFMGSGSTIAAAQAQGIASIGIERFVDYFEMSKQSIPRLARLTVETDTAQLNLLDLLEV